MGAEGDMGVASAFRRKDQEHVARRAPAESPKV